MSVQMHLSIIAQFQDRASRAMKSLLRLQQQHERMQKAYGNATSQAARKQAELARANARTARAMGSEASAAARLRQALARVNEMIRRQVSLRERLRRAGSLAREGLGRMGHTAALGAGIYGSVQAGAASLASLVVGPAAQVEGYMVQLQALEGSVEKARKAMSWITRFATKTPLELHQVIDAYAQLRTFGIDPTNGSLQALVDTMAMSGKGYEHLQGLILAVGQAWVKGKLQGEEIMQMTERMVPVWDLLSKAMGKPVPVIQKLASKGKLGRDVIAKLIELMGKRAAGASEKFSRTWNGMVTNMADMWFKFRLMVAHSGVFEWLKSKLAYLLDVFNKLEASGRLQQVAQQIGQSIITGLKNLWQFGLGVWAVLKRVGATLAWAADKLGGWNNLAMLLMAIPLTNVFVNAASGIMLLGRAFVALAPALALVATPVGAVVAGLAALGAAAVAALSYLGGWPAIAARLRAAWQSLANGAQALANYLARAFSTGFAQTFGALGPVGERLAAAWQRLAAAGARLMAVFDRLGGGGALRLLAGQLGKLAEVLGKLAGAGLDLAVLALEGIARAAELLAIGVSHAIAAGQAFVAFLAALPGRVQNAWQALTQWLAQPFDPFPGLRQRVQHIINVLTGLPQRALAAMQAVATTIASLDIGVLIRGVDWMGLLQHGLNAALNAVRAAFAGLNLFEAGVKALQSFWAGLKSVIGDLADWVRKRLASIFKLPKIKLPSFSGWWGGNNAQKAQQATAQARAAGGPFRGGPLLVGERGPELIYAARSGWVAHNDNLKRLIALSRRAAASIAAASVATHMALTPPRIEPASPPARLIAAGGSGQQAANAGGQQVTVHYAPQVTVQGAAGAEDVQAALDAHLDRLLDMLERRQRERERLEF